MKNSYICRIIKKNFVPGFLILINLGLIQIHAAKSKPVYEWISANECYFILPVYQDIHLPDNGDTESVKPWGFGFRTVGNEKFSKTGGLQFQSIKVSNPSTGRNTFYLLEVLFGMEYISQKIQQKHLRWTASVFADLGLSGNTLYAAPIISAGLLYVTNQFASTPVGFTFNVFYRFTDIYLNNVGNDKKGILEPAFGFKIGYIFEGFWSTKEKSKEKLQK